MFRELNPFVYLAHPHPDLLKPLEVADEHARERVAEEVSLVCATQDKVVFLFRLRLHTGAWRGRTLGGRRGPDRGRSKIGLVKERTDRFKRYQVPCVGLRHPGGRKHGIVKDSD